MTNPKQEKNVFFDINKLPAEPGNLLFPISLNRIDNSQKPENIIEHFRVFTPSKVSIPRIGSNLVYGDFLYLYSEESAYKLKEEYMNAILRHKNGVNNLIKKNPIEFQIQDAFNFLNWNQFYFLLPDFIDKFEKLKKIYKEDAKYQNYIAEDLRSFNKEVNEINVNFFLEEHLVFYLVSKSGIKIPNKFIEEKEKYNLWCYPGKPPKNLVYLYQLNPFKLDNPENKYQDCFYDLESKELIEFDRVDLETYKVK